jgi:hypothetical protein
VLLAAMTGTLAAGALPRWLGWAAIAALAINSVLVGVATARMANWQTAIIWKRVIAARGAGPFCGNFGAAHARIELMREAGVHVIPLSGPLPLACPGARPISFAIDFNERPAQSCPCEQVAHDPQGRWIVPPDTTIEDIRAYKARR